MKSKYTLIKYVGMIGLIVLVLLYLNFFFFPSIEEINRLKRESADLSQKINDFRKVESTFVFPDEREKQTWKVSNDAIKSLLPEIKGREDFVRFFTEVFDYLKTTAQKDGVANLVISANSKELEINAGTLVNNKQTLTDLLGYVANRLTEIEIKKSTPEAQNLLQPPSQDLIKSGETTNIEQQLIYVSLGSELKNTLNFMNHIPWGPYQLEIAKVIMAEGKYTPNTTIFLHVFYRDLRKNEKK